MRQEGEHLKFTFGLVRKHPEMHVRLHIETASCWSCVLSVTSPGNEFLLSHWNDLLWTE
jgi:hypothetical protein